MRRSQETQLLAYQSQGCVFDMMPNNDIIIVMKKTPNTTTLEEKSKTVNKSDTIYHADELQVVDFISIGPKPATMDSYNHDRISYTKGGVVTSPIGTKHTSCCCSRWYNVDMYDGIVFYKTYNDAITRMELDRRPCYR
jgi:hypothetical protein